MTIDMENIEERAEKAFEQYKGVNWYDFYTDGYIQGATDQDPISRAEQKKIDIENACKFVKKICEGTLKQSWKYDYLEQLRNTMEE